MGVTVAGLQQADFHNNRSWWRNQLEEVGYPYPGRWAPYPWNSILNGVIALGIFIATLIWLETNYTHLAPEMITLTRIYWGLLFVSLAFLLVRYLVFLYSQVITRKFWIFALRQFAFLFLPIFMVLSVGIIFILGSICFTLANLGEIGLIYLGAAGITFILAMLMASPCAYRDIVLRVRDFLWLSVLSLIYGGIFLNFVFRTLYGLLEYISTFLNNFLNGAFTTAFFVGFLLLWYFSLLVFVPFYVGWYFWSEKISPVFHQGLLTDRVFVSRVLNSFLNLANFSIALSLSISLAMFTVMFPAFSALFVMINSVVVGYTWLILLIVTLIFTFTPFHSLFPRLKERTYVLRPFARAVVLLGILLFSWWLMHIVAMAHIDMFNQYVSLNHLTFVMTTASHPPNLIDFGFYVFSLLVHGGFAEIQPYDPFGRIYVAFVALTSVLLLVVFLRTAFSRR